MSSTASIDPVTRQTPAPQRPTADAEAAANVAGNLAALGEIQPALVERLRDGRCDVSWLHGRDGTVTAVDAAGAWWEGCSVPRAASRAMLQSLDASGTIACFLLPFHAAAIRTALDRLRSEQAIVAILPDERALAIMLRCEDFSRDIAYHRLWFITGQDWQAGLDRFLADHPGLPAPTQFIRLRDGNEESADAMVEPAQRLINRHAGQRARAVAALRDRPRSRNAAAIDPARICVIAPSRFRLWNDAGHALGVIGRAAGCRVLDPDDPLFASQWALAEAIDRCDAIVAPNAFRTAAAGVAPMEVPWITWLTSPRIPEASSAGERDALVLADERWREQARSKGWPAERTFIAPMSPACAEPIPAGAERVLTIIADTASLQPPAHIVDMSSHRLLWELVRDEVLADPFALGSDEGAYLDRWLSRSGISAEAIDRRCLMEDLIAPAYAQGIARALSAGGVPLRVLGRGWDDLPGALWRGPVVSRDAFVEAIGTSIALVHVWLAPEAHPVEGAGRPVLGRCRNRTELLDWARRLLTEPVGAPAGPSRNPLLPQQLMKIVAGALA